MQFKINKLLPIFVFLLSFILVVPIINVSAAPDGSYIPDFKSEPLEGGIFRVYDGDSFENSHRFFRVDWTNSFNTLLSIDNIVPTKQTFEAKANPGYKFVGWYDDKGLVSIDNPYKSGKTANNVIVAKFEKLDDNQIATTFTGFIDVSSDFVEFNTGNEWLSIVSDSESEETNNSDQQYAVVKSQVDFELENDGLLMFDWFWCGFVPDKRYSVSYTLYKDGESFVSGDLSQEYYAIFRAYPGGVLIDNPKSESISLSKGSYLLEFSFNNFYKKECLVVVQDLIVKETNDISNSYSVSLPKKVDVSQNTTTFDVKVSNNDLWNVSVTMPDKITLNDQAVKDNKPKDPIDVNVEFENGVFNKDETRVATLTHNGISSGNWKADMNVNINADNRITYELVDGRTFDNVVNIFFNDSKNDYFGPLKQIIFTDEPMPESVGDLNLDPGVNKKEVKGLDADGDGGVVAWVDRGYVQNNKQQSKVAPPVPDGAKTTLFISTQKAGQKVIANENCNNMFKGNEVSFSAPFTYVSYADLSMLDVSNVTDMSYMFNDFGGESPFIDFSGWNTSNVIDMSGMFNNLGSTTSSYFSLDLSNFDTSNVTDMNYMFNGSTNLKTIYISDEWNTDNVLHSTEMFDHASSLVGGSGTVYDDTKTDKSMANYHNGYLTHINQHRIIVDDEDVPYLPDSFPKYYMTGEGLTSISEPIGRDGFEFLGWNALVDIETDKSYLDAGEGIINALLDKADTYYLINDSIDLFAGEEPEISGSNRDYSILDKDGNDVTNEGQLLKLNDKDVFKTPKDKAPYTVTFVYRGMTPNTDVSDFITDYYIFDDTNIINTYDDISIDAFGHGSETKTLNIDVGNNENAYIYFDFIANNINGGYENISLNRHNILSIDSYDAIDNNYLFKLEKGVNSLEFIVQKGYEPDPYGDSIDSTSYLKNIKVLNNPFITDSIPVDTEGDITLIGEWKELSKATLNVDNLIDKFADKTYQGNDFYDTREHMDIAFEDGYELDWDDELAKIKSGDYSNIVGLDELIDETVVATYNILDVSAIRDEVWGNPSDEPYTTTLNGIIPENFIAIYFDTSIQKWNVAESVVNGNTITINFNKKPDVVNRTPFDIDYGNNSNFIEGQDIPSEYYVGRGTKLPELAMSQEGVEPFFEKYHYGWYIQGFTTDVNDSSFTIPDDVIGNIKLMAVESNRYIGSRMKFDINGGNPIEDDDLSTPDIYDQIFYTKDGLNVSDMRVPTHPDGLDFKGWFSPYPVKVTINDNDENGDIIGNGTELITKTINGSYNLESTETTKSNYLMHLVFDSTNSSYEFESITYTLNGNVVYSYNGSFDDEIIDLWLFIPSNSDYVVDVKVKEKDGALEPFKSAEMLLEEFFDINDIKPETQNYYYLARAFYGDYKELFISEDQIKTGADLEIFDEPVTYAFNSISSNELNDGKFIIIEDMSQLSEGKFDDISISNSVTIESYMVDDVDTELDNTTIEDDNNSSNENDDNENKDLGNGNELDKPSESESPDINVDTDSDDEIIPSPSPSPDTNLPITTPTDKSEEDDLDIESDITELADDSVVQS